MTSLHRIKLSAASLLLGMICFFSSCYHDANGFVIPTAETANAFRERPVGTAFIKTRTPRRGTLENQRIQMMPIDMDLNSFTDAMTSSSFHLSDVAVFDGSSIVDPVVVSSSFWSSLQRQLLSVILGQFIATIAFAVVASFLAPQLSKLRDTILSKFTDAANNIGEAPKKPFIKADSVPRREPDFGKLLICLLIDIVGTSSEALPIVGELTDVLTAPAAALILQNLYPGSSKFVFAFEFAEEILPLTDFIPFATICWVVDTYFPESSVADVFQLGSYSASTVTAAEKADSFDTTTERLNQDFDNNTKR